MRMDIRLFKLFFIFFLFFFFLFIFGVPAVKRYLAANVAFRATKMEPQRLDAPAMTVCVDAGDSLKIEIDFLSKTNEKFIEFACGANISAAEYYRCHKNITYSREEIILGSSIQSNHYSEEIQLVWNEVFQLADYGVCQTTIPDVKINSSSTFLLLRLNPALPYQIFLHDPTIFFLSLNPKAFDRVQTSFSRDSSITAQVIEATRYSLLNRPSSPCQDDPGYNFTACLGDFVHRQVGCDFGLCSEMEEIINYLDNWTALMFENDQYVQRYTGCLLPCSYIKYEKSQEPLVLTGDGQAIFSVAFSTNVLTVMEEEYVYPIDSFIAEIGGALGLFLGVSFLTIWDLIQFGYESTKNFKSIK